MHIFGLSVYYCYICINNSRKKSCKECPWNKDSSLYPQWRDYIKEKIEIGKLSSYIHRCHMITNETFSDNLLEEPTDNV